MPLQVYFGKCGAAGKALGKIFYVWNCVIIRNGGSVECTVVATGSPNADLLGHEEECGRPRSRGAPGCSVPQQSGLETA